tara:strand:+ start:82 stop:1197 length:1116 start_codon:yes stop_codon:yes gene_type:complete
MDRFITDGEISISEEDWKELNYEHSKDEIKEILSDLIDDHSIQMPMRKISNIDAKEDFLKLIDLDHHKIFEKVEWCTRYDYDEEFFFLYEILKCNNVGNKSSDYFQQTNRWNCDSINSPSPHRSWYIKRFRLTLFNALWSLKVKKVDMATLRTCIALRKYIASQFRPSTAKAIYNRFEAKNVLDFSSGWGDRLSGFFSSNAESYVGIDPNTPVYETYRKQIHKYSSLRDKKVEMLNGCAEDMDLGDRMFDLIFTSPPYFNIEKYSKDDSQSFKKFKKIEDWLEGFLFKAIGNAWKHLEVGGHMLINISDVYSNHTVNNICDPMNHFIKSFDDSEYVGAMGYEMRKRPNSGSLKGKTGKFAEPIWIWRKNEN